MKLLLGPLLGHVGPRHATAWAMTSPPAEGRDALEIDARPAGGARSESCRLATRADAGGTGAASVPLPGEPGTLHRLEVRAAGGAALAEMSVRSAPAPSAEGDVAFAFGSCWLPTRARHPEAAWEILLSLARARHVDHLLLVGDQVYADEVTLEPAPSRGASGVTATERVLAMGPGAPLDERLVPYRDLYLRSWRSPSLQAAQALLPTTLTWDDHEIANGWGSAGWHASAPGRGLFEAAARAYEEFQGCRNPPPLVAGCTAHAFRRGPAAFLSLDLRTHRSAATGTLLGQAQRRAVEAYVAGEAREAPLLFVVLSVPPLHLPMALRSLRAVTDVADQWSSPSNLEDRRWLLGLIADYEEGGRRRAVLLGGDSHVATLASITHPEGAAGGGRRTWQVTSSPLAMRLPPYVRWALSLMGTEFRVRVGDTVARARIERRWTGANVGVVRGAVRAGRPDLWFEVYRPGRRTEAMRLA